MIPNTNQDNNVNPIKPITMKKILLTFISLFLIGVVFSQPTQGQIFNFSVGDVFETKIYGSVNPTYRLDTIVSKTINGDSIHYVIHRNYLADGPSPSSGQSVEYIDIDVTQPAVFDPPIGTCAPTIDSSYIGNCGQTVWHRETYFDTCAIDPPMWSADLMEGLGGEYFWYWDASNPNPSFSIRYELIYSNTTQWGVCGNYHSWFVGINELEIAKKTVIKVIDLLGREIKVKPNTPLIYIYSDGTQEKVYHME